MPMAYALHNHPPNRNMLVILAPLTSLALIFSRTRSVGFVAFDSVLYQRLVGVVRSDEFNYTNVAATIRPNLKFIHISIRQAITFSTMHVLLLWPNSEFGGSVLGVGYISAPDSD